MRRNPRGLISSIPRDNKPIVMSELDKYLQEILEDKDEEHQTYNNWYSMFIYGIYCSESAKHWLVNRHNGIVTGAIDRMS
ncbi:hypothetical protein CBP31_01945 [Oceanisphaera profunda]|uniref:Uncharacterized protein n=1 Tax=Oceanisphaera profunda TaxID=1416627 RepID=A0A1Y0D202_9GAMM|nr:hypothetical protein CBP31_01945 [Oceanisphaera profunda]